MTRTTRTAPRRVASLPRSVPLALAAGALLAGCAPDLPQPAPEAPPAVAPPAVTLEQSGAILEDLGAVLTAADSALTVAGLEPRVSGPALVSRAAEYAVAGATGGAQAVTALPVEPQTLVVPSTTEWPRTQLVVTEQPDDLSSPRLLVLRQESPRAQYELWAWARLLPGAQMPATASPESGSAPVALESTALAVTPADVAVQYADLLGNGDASAFAATFATPDPFRDQVVTARAERQQIATTGAGTYTETYAPVPDQTVAVATTDGGAIVVSGMTTSSNLTISGASIRMPAEFAAVSGGTVPADAVLRNNLAVTYTDVVAFYVPPAGAATPVRVLGAEHTYTSASGS